MAEISINTTQNVNINFNVADIGLRIGAYAIDLALKTAYGILVFFFVIQALGIHQAMLDQWTLVSIYTFFSLPIMFYSLVQETLMEGQTIGKKALSIKVVKIDGYQASFVDYLIRWVFRLVDVSMFFGTVGLIAMAVSKIHQRLGDMAAGTAIITLKNDINISHTILMEVSSDYQPTFAQVIKFSDNDMRIIKETLALAIKNNDPELLKKLVKKVEDVAGIKCEGKQTAFINTVIKDYNYYTGQ